MIDCLTCLHNPNCPVGYRKGNAKCITLYKDIPEINDTFEVIIDNKRVIAYKHIEGHRLVPGDMYIGKRNTGWQLGKCLYVNHESAWVMSDPPASMYSYDCYECRKVKEIIDID